MKKIFRSRKKTWNSKRKCEDKSMIKTTMKIDGMN